MYFQPLCFQNETTKLTKCLVIYTESHIYDKTMTKTVSRWFLNWSRDFEQSRRCYFILTGLMFRTQSCGRWTWQKKTKKTGADPFDPGSFGILWISFKNVSIRNTIRMSGKAAWKLFAPFNSNWEMLFIRGLITLSSYVHEIRAQVNQTVRSALSAPQIFL